MEITITLTNREVKVIKALANKAGIPSLQYGKNIIRNFLKGQTRGIFQQEFNKKSNDELAQIFGEITD